MKDDSSAGRPAKYYRDGLERASREAARLQQRIYRTSLLRVLLFVAGVAGLVCFRAGSAAALCAIALLAAVPFAALVWHHNRLFVRKDYREQEAAVNRQELAALEHDTSSFDDGSEFADPAHPYADDLDVFGPRSLFQYVNRTCTRPGKLCLASWMERHLESASDIVQRQEAVRELAENPEFRLRFRVTGLLHKGRQADESELHAWAAAPAHFRSSRLLRVLPCAVGGLNAACLLGVAAGVLEAATWGGVWACCLVAGFAFTGKITRMQGVYGKKLQILGTYARLLRLVDRLPVHSPLLQALKGDTGGEGQQASLAIRRLGKLMNELDWRNNYLAYAVLNGTFFWDLWQIMRIEKWKKQHASRLPRWIAAIGQVDALCSLGTFAFNHPDYAYPTFTDKPFCLRAKQMGHPLMESGRCVRNDIDIPARPYFVVITGANMAGKSTYLRTTGVNYLLACIGAPACATGMELYPARLITSLHTRDSLNDNESYFFAELKRLKLIIDRLKAGETLFIILDEILKGTNSADKQKGSLALIRQFMALQADGIIATHDLALGSLAARDPAHIRNFCFEADITGDGLAFSYRLRPGVAQNMNACFLMEKMGIAIPATD